MFTKWSSSLSITYVVLADLRTEGNKKAELRMKEKFIDNICANWENDKQVLPFTDEILARYINPKYLQKPIYTKAD